MKKRLLILGDSLALPREKPEYCAFEDTWPQLLKATGEYEIHQVSIGGATISDLHRQLHYHKLFNPDIVVVQVGIVDCAPRFASRFEIELLKRIPFVGAKILNLLNDPRVRNLRKKKFTDLRSFKGLSHKLETFFINAPVYFLGIVPASLHYEEKLPYITENIEKYNAVFQQK